jgi:hypothetical protein
MQALTVVGLIAAMGDRFHRASLRPSLSHPIILVLKTSGRPSSAKLHRVSGTKYAPFSHDRLSA